MKNTVLILKWFFVCMTILQLLSGCATVRGLPFNGLDLIPKGKANLYVYFLVNEKRVGALTSGFDIVINDTKKDTLAYQSYVVYSLEPGDHVIAVGERWTSPKQVRAKLTAEVGKNYFLRFDDSGSYQRYAGIYKVDELDARRLEFRSEAQALNDLPRLNRLN
jgi:Protein of unknown function (DUF2846)